MMTSRFLIEDATADDLPAILEIYNDVILTTTAIYSEEPTTLEERAGWLAGKQRAGEPCLVARRREREQAIGFATYGEFRARPCYRHSAEHSVHIAGTGAVSAPVPHCSAHC